MAKSKCKKPLGRFQPVARNKKPWHYLPENKISRTLKVKRAPSVTAVVASFDAKYLRDAIAKRQSAPSHLSAAAQ